MPKCSVPPEWPANDCYIGASVLIVRGAMWTVCSEHPAVPQPAISVRPGVARAVTRPRDVAGGQPCWPGIRGGSRPGLPQRQRYSPVWCWLSCLARARALAGAGPLPAGARSGRSAQPPARTTADRPAPPSRTCCHPRSRRPNRARRSRPGRRPPPRKGHRSTGDRDIATRPTRPTRPGPPPSQPRPRPVRHPGSCPAASAAAAATRSARLRPLLKLAFISDRVFG
jgi:hypothetical protein